MDFGLFLLGALLFTWALPFNLLVIRFFQSARDNGTFMSYLVTFSYALFIVVFDVILVNMLVEYTKM